MVFADLAIPAALLLGWEAGRAVRISRAYTPKSSNTRCASWSVDQSSEGAWRCALAPQDAAGVRFRPRTSPSCLTFPAADRRAWQCHLL